MRPGLLLQRYFVAPSPGLDELTPEASCFVLIFPHHGHDWPSSGPFFFTPHSELIFVFLVQDLTNALVLDLDYPALRKNKNIETFLNKCKSPLRNGQSTNGEFFAVAQRFSLLSLNSQMRKSSHRPVICR